jgi:uncharacterized protein YukE
MTSPDSIGFDPLVLEPLVTALAQAGRKYDGRLTDFENFVRPRLAEWDGDSQALYLEHKMRWDQAIRDIREDMEKLWVTIQQLGNIVDGGDRGASQVLSGWSPQ